MDEDSDFEFEIPEEMQPWIKFQKEKEGQDKKLGLPSPEEMEKFLENRHYILVNGKIKKATLLEWGEWFSDLDSRRIDYTEFEDGSYVSTVFLGLDHSTLCLFDINKKVKPVLFESMAFGGKLDQFQWRYSSFGEAKQGHWEIVDAIREERDPKMDVGVEGFWNMFREMFEDDEDDE